MLTTDPTSLIVFSDADALGDDGVAICLLMEDTFVSVRALVATSGNVWADEAASYLRNIVKFAGQKVPVFMGVSDKASLARLQRSSEANRPSYTGVVGRQRIRSLSGQETELADLAQSLLELGPADWIVLGPATTPAALLGFSSEVRAAVSRIFVMGGLLVPLPARGTEFNFWFDPIAAERLLRERITLVPMDAVLPLRYDVPALGRHRSRSLAGRYLHKRLQVDPKAMFCDEALALALLEPSIVERKQSLILEVTMDEITRQGALRSVEAGSSAPTSVILKFDLTALNASLSRRLGLPCGGTYLTMT